MNLEAELAEAAAHVCQKRGLKLVRELGSGAFKRAYLVQSAETEFALKLAPIIGPVDRLIRETDALLGCAHPNIASLFEAFPDHYNGKPLWVAIEQFIPGGTLEDRLSKGRLSREQTLNLARPLAGVLQHLFERRLVHRDIKPANILFAADGQTPVLTDFGIVRVLDLPSLTREFLAFGPGTPAYAAPEQLNNEKNLIDWRTDQFELAIVLSECVLGRHPFMLPDQNIHSAIIEVASKREVPQESRDQLEELGMSMLIRALSPWPVGRYRQPHDFIAALAD
ncbi:serine/threonine-protein kinase [Lysobacter firmicutimachus]|uniref:non-specific serine/threonine protein kinase n=1 Tax=Lysobacter firmicutimachus TaxID=1792846 RepID=A0ABU8D240_9GAMM